MREALPWFRISCMAHGNGVDPNETALCDEGISSSCRVFFEQEDILMRSILRMIVLTPALCTTAAFAVDRVSVNMPFSFESHGRVFPASRYDVGLSDDRRMITLTSRTNPADRASWMTLSADVGPMDPELSMQFDQNGRTPELRAVRLGTHRTPILDVHPAGGKSQTTAQSGQ
jgi:hypothetical protein